jgi:hypothetical protein
MSLSKLMLRTAATYLLIRGALGLACFIFKLGPSHREFQALNKAQRLGLAVSTVYDAHSFAWGFSGGPPSVGSRWFSRVVVVAWNGAWFYLIYRVVV